MSTTRRILIGVGQVIAGTVVGYIAFFLTISLITGLFVVGLALAAIAGAAAIWGVGRLVRAGGSFSAAVAGAGIGAAVGFVILLTGLARDNTVLYLLLLPLPGVLGTLSYWWDALRTPSAPTV